MLLDAYELPDGPSCIRWPKTAAPSVSDDEVGRGLSGRRVRAGSGVCLIGVGKLLASAEEAADLLLADGIEATVWDPRVVKPLDPVMLADAAEHDLVVSIEDGLRDGGVGSRIADELGRTTRVEVLGVPTEYFEHDNPEAILSRLGLDGEGVARAVRDLIGTTR